MDEADIFHSNYPPPTNYFWQSILVGLAIIIIKRKVAGSAPEIELWA
jgi:hypothetical protein